MTKEITQQEYKNSIDDIVRIVNNTEGDHQEESLRILADSMLAYRLHFGAEYKVSIDMGYKQVSSFDYVAAELATDYEGISSDGL